MPLAYPRTSARRPALPEVVVLGVVTLLLLAAAAGTLPALGVVALTATAGSALAGTRLSRLAANPPRPAVRNGDTRAAARRRAARPRRAAVLLGAAVVAAGLTTTVLPLAGAAHRNAVAVAGPAVVATLFGFGLTALAGSPRPPARVRLRRLTDAAEPGAGLALAGWLILPRDSLGAPVRLVAAVTLGTLAVGALTAVTGPRRLGGAARCRGGGALTLTGLLLLTTLTAGTLPDRAGLLAVPPLVGGVLLTAAGARRELRPDLEPPPRPTAVWPRVVVPAVAVVAATGWWLGAGLASDPTAVLLALAVVPPLVLRELLRSLRHPDSRRTAGVDPTAEGPGIPVTGGPDEPAALPQPPAPSRPGRSAPAGERGALLRALAALQDMPHPSGALLVVDLHAPTAAAAEQLAGPELTGEVARRTRAVLGPGDLVVDATTTDFAVATGVGPVLAYALGTRLVAALTRPYPGAGGTVRLQVSIGLAETGGTAAEAVLRQADLARRRAVQLGRDRVEWYDAYLEEQLVRRLDLERELPGAVARGELDLVFQPVLGLVDRQPMGAEALLRWRSPVLGTVLPAELLPVAEDLDVVGELGCWVLDRACRQLAAWTGAGRELFMTINVSVRELTAPDFVPRTAAVLDAYGLAPEQLVVEVAEPRVAAELPTVVARLAGLRSLGVRTALDDFRAEHASLAQLRRLPIDLLKVGPQLVGRGADQGRPLIDVVVNVGDRLGLEIVAEELESDEQVEGARRAGCRYGQGFALARPATAERVEAYFEEFPFASR
ncbi:GGDEF domain-containing protein [Micromonospora sp. WMMA1363]|uniref:bifunctional diguanylate cyclase/phosphodiesterase n=1 Tax=Micromonospora sp. WMMA1363 TaxID=3053985 RepID=UPI00259CB399|nr:GGDEF domain-containing protein [Micromonospora sp. WMMA1363]MDM4722885.1 GGDEF domain-containing protein [Micromonospora sp. WMMA1363]